MLWGFVGYLFVKQQKMGNIYPVKALSPGLPVMLSQVFWSVAFRVLLGGKMRTKTPQSSVGSTFSVQNKLKHADGKMPRLWWHPFPLGRCHVLSTWNGWLHKDRWSVGHDICLHLGPRYQRRGLSAVFLLLAEWEWCLSVFDNAFCIQNVSLFIFWWILLEAICLQLHHSSAELQAADCGLTSFHQLDDLDALGSLLSPG